MLVHIKKEKNGVWKAILRCFGGTISVKGSTYKEASDRLNALTGGAL